MSKHKKDIILKKPSVQLYKVFQFTNCYNWPILTPPFAKFELKKCKVRGFSERIITKACQTVRKGEREQKLTKFGSLFTKQSYQSGKHFSNDGLTLP